ncbi:MAG: hypothetical protein V2B15_15250 [Bacteroidota bacterium]
MSRLLPYLFFLTLLSCNDAQKDRHETSPVTNASPSKSMYFDWININWYGGNENKVISNLLFFKWMHEEYGMELDIYLLDAGNIDNGPVCNGCVADLQNAPRYGGIESGWFKNKYPNGLDSIVSLAASFGCEIGLWIGPDGYGTSDSSARARIDMLDKLTRDYHIALFKMDACCSDLDPENEKYFIEAMQKSYANNPDLIILNHRITLSDSARKYTSTFLWEGAETYIEVSASNDKPAPHHRYTLERGLPPDLQRLTEDHGVCLSSCLDYWEDDLILQAFNRNLILAPEIYGNPWLLSDDEFPLLARIFNLHKKYNQILVEGKVLPESQYGLSAVSRGDETTRFLTFRNLSWETKNIVVDIDESIGLANARKFEVRQYHPYEKIIGSFEFGEQVNIEVLPFRSCLVKISSEPVEFGIEGCNYRLIKEIPDEEMQIDLYGFPGEEKKIKLVGKGSKFTKAFIDGQEVPNFKADDCLIVNFQGSDLKSSYHRYLGPLSECDIPSSADVFFETMFFSASNNCLEVQSLTRSGNSDIDAVINARKAFFEDEIFLKVGAWDQFVFDNNPATSFKVRDYCDYLRPGELRLSLPYSMNIDRLSIDCADPQFKAGEASVSNDLYTWQKVDVAQNDGVIEINIPSPGSIRFFKLSPAPKIISELRAYSNFQQLDISKSTLSNLFPSSGASSVKKAWEGRFTIDEIQENSTIAVAIEGEYGENGAFALLQVNDSLMGAFDRSPTFIFNNWEHVAAPQNGNYTYYFKVPAEFQNTVIVVHVFGLQKVDLIKTPEVWLTAYPIPFQKRRLVLVPASFEPSH